MKNLSVVDNYLKREGIDADKLLRLTSSGLKASELGLHHGQVIRLKSYGLLKFKRPMRKWYPGPDLKRLADYRRRKESI